MAERQAHSGSLMVPLMAGLAGAGIALLFAPRSGQETRNHMKGRVEDLQQQAKEAALSAKTQVTASVEQAKGVKNRVKSAIKEDPAIDTTQTTSTMNDEEM